jgi:Omp85 superfamily domain
MTETTRVTFSLIQTLTRAALASAAALFLALPAAAQPTREAIATDQRIAKSHDVHPVEPGTPERLLLKFSHDRVLERVFDPRRGLFVRVGLPTEGAGFGAGPAWRASNYSRSYTFTASTAASVTREWIGELALQVPDLLPSLADDRFFGSLSVSRAGRISNEFWGLGNSSADADRTAFRYSQTASVGTLGVRLMPWLSVGTAAAWLEPHLRNDPGEIPSIQSAFNESTAPGLTEQTAFLKTEVSVDLDYRDSLPPTRTAIRLDQLPIGGASRGGRYQVTLASYRDQELGRYSFRQTTIDLQQHVPLLHGYRVLSLRGLAVLSDASDGQVVPFYLSPTFGGLKTGRGFPSFRFRDENLLVLQAEYRYEINPLMSGAIFVDAGQVASSARGLAWSKFKTTYGTGVRLGARGAAGLRLDVAFGGESPKVILGLGHAF